MTGIALGLALLGLLAPPQSEISTIEGVLLGNDGGNRVGVFRVLAGDRIEKVSRTGETQYDAPVSELRFRIGGRLRLRAVDSGGEPSARRRIRARRIEVLSGPGREWQLLNGRMESLLRLFTSGPEKCGSVLRTTAGLEMASRDTLLWACRQWMLATDAAALGTQSWTVAERTPRGFPVVINPAAFGGGSGVSMSVETTGQGATIPGARVVDWSSYMELF